MPPRGAAEFVPPSAAKILLTFLPCQESDKEAKNLQFYRLVGVRSKVFVRLPKRFHGRYSPTKPSELAA